MYICNFWPRHIYDNPQSSTVWVLITFSGVILKLTFNVPSSDGGLGRAGNRIVRSL